MTIKLPKPSILDWFLHFIGKKRGVYIPTKVYENHGQYVFAVCKKDNIGQADAKLIFGNILPLA